MKFIISLFILFSTFLAVGQAFELQDGFGGDYDDESSEVTSAPPNPIIHRPVKVQPQNPIFTPRRPRPNHRKALAPGRNGLGVSGRGKGKVKSHWGKIHGFKGHCRRDNKFEMGKILAMVNRHRMRNGRGSIKLSRGCNQFANYIGTRNAKESRRGNILHFTEMSNQREVRAKKRKFGLRRAMSENIAWGQGGQAMCSAEAVFSGWRRSPGHNRNMLGSSWRSMGISRVVTRSGEVHWTQCFQ